mgnify:CR=1 FL=1
MNEIENALSGLKRLELTLGNSIFRSQDDLTISFLNKELETVCIAQKALLLVSIGAFLINLLINLLIFIWA